MINYLDEEHILSLDSLLLYLASDEGTDTNNLRLVSEILVASVVLIGCLRSYVVDIAKN